MAEMPHPELATALTVGTVPGGSGFEEIGAQLEQTSLQCEIPKIWMTDLAGQPNVVTPTHGERLQPAHSCETFLKERNDMK